MTTTLPVWLKVDEGRVVEALQEAGQKLVQGAGEVVLDFSAVHRIAPSALLAMEELADRAAKNATKVVLRGVNVDIYKVLKLARLTAPFLFVD
jgi:anti-anti-sigma regulatory factor